MIMTSVSRLTWVVCLGLGLMATNGYAETVDVKYRGLVDLKPFACVDTVSSFVNRVCYDEAKSYMLILLKSTWYHYCSIDSGTVNALKTADSKGSFYNASIKGK